MTDPKHRHRSHRRNRETDATPFWEDKTGVSPAVFLLSCLVFVAGLLLGGSAASFGDVVVQLLALPLIVLSAMHWSRSQLKGPDWGAIAMIAGIAVLAFVQLVPLPLSVWSSLPARADLLHDMQSVGATPTWQSLSLNPYATERSLQWTLPAIAMFLAVRWMSPRQRRILLLVLFVGALVLLILKIAHGNASQGNALATAKETIAKANLALFQGPTQAAAPPLPPFAVGLFSNRNHFGTFLAMSFPLVVAMGLRVWVDRDTATARMLAPLASLLVLVMVGLLAGMFQTGSRAALALGGIALLGSLTLLRDLRLNRVLVRSVAACTVVGALVAIQMAATVSVGRLDTGPGTDTRWEFHATTMDAAHRFGPLGSGLGTFVEAYQQVPPVEGYWPDYVNHAHGDYHELWLETGVPGVLLLVGFIGWFGWSSWRVWRHSKSTGALTLISRAATISVLLVLLHSYLDYPLRRTAILVVFGMACALLAPTEDLTQRKPSRTRSLESRKSEA